MSRPVNGNMQVLPLKVQQANRGITARSQLASSDAVLEDAVSQQLATSGEKDRLKSELRERLAACGWQEDVSRHAREVVAKAKGGQQMTADDIVAAVRQRGRQRVPDQIKAELLTELRSIILKQ